MLQWPAHCHSAPALAKSAPDGYTIGIGIAGTQTMNPSAFPVLGYDPEKEFEPITLTGARHVR